MVAEEGETEMAVSVHAVTVTWVEPRNGPLIAVTVAVPALLGVTCTVLDGPGELSEATVESEVVHVTSVVCSAPNATPPSKNPFFAVSVSAGEPVAMTGLSGCITILTGPFCAEARAAITNRSAEMRPVLDSADIGLVGD